MAAIRRVAGLAVELQAAGEGVGGAAFHRDSVEVPRRSKSTVFPSGETSTDIQVPSVVGEVKFSLRLKGKSFAGFGHGFSEGGEREHRARILMNILVDPSQVPLHNVEYEFGFVGSMRLAWIDHHFGGNAAAL